MIIDVKNELLNMLLQCQELSSVQKIAIHEMSEYLRNVNTEENVTFSWISNSEDKIGENIPITTNKRVVIDNNLFIQYPIAITRSKTPVCDFIYRDKAGAKFYTGLSAAQRKCLWDFLGPAKYRLQGVQFVIGHSLLFIG